VSIGSYRNRQATSIRPRPSNRGGHLARSGPLAIWAIVLFRLCLPGPVGWEVPDIFVLDWRRIMIFALPCISIALLAHGSTTPIWL